MCFPSALRRGGPELASFLADPVFSSRAVSLANHRRAQLRGSDDSCQRQLCLQGCQPLPLGLHAERCWRCLRQISSHDVAMGQSPRSGRGIWRLLHAGSSLGQLHVLSYRDPNLLETLRIYDRTPAFLRQSEPHQNELTRSIIGTVGSVDAYQLPDAKGCTSMQRYLAGETDRIRQRRRDEILGASVTNLRARLLNRSRRPWTGGRTRF